MLTICLYFHRILWKNKLGLIDIQIKRFCTLHCWCVLCNFYEAMFILINKTTVLREKIDSIFYQVCYIYVVLYFYIALLTIYGKRDNLLIVNFS